MSRAMIGLLAAIVVTGCLESTPQNPGDAGAPPSDVDVAWPALPDGAPPDASSTRGDAPDASNLDASLSPVRWRLPVRVHLLESNLEALDGAGLYTPERLQDYLEHLNETFAQAEVEWFVESVRTEDAVGEEAYRDALEAGEAGPASIRRALSYDAQLAPEGWDLYVVRTTAQHGFGGVYLCSPNGQRGRGIMIVPWLAAGGAAQDRRKWTHEFGHAAGLAHPECVLEHRDNLMTSGSCTVAAPDRRDLAPGQIERLQTQAERGGPAACGTLITGFD